MFIYSLNAFVFGYDYMTRMVSKIAMMLLPVTVIMPNSGIMIMRIYKWTIRKTSI